MKRRTIAGSVIGTGLFAALILTAGPASSSDPSFSNPSPITFPDPGLSGPAAPYASTISVSGLSGVIADVNVTLKGLQHAFPDDVDVLLVAPGGQQSILMSDVGCGYPVTGVDLTLDDDAAASLPDSTAIPSTGSHAFKPTQGVSNACPNAFGGSFPAPAP